MTEKHLAIFKGVIKENYWYLEDNSYKLHNAKKALVYFLGGDGYLYKDRNREISELREKIANFKHEINLGKTVGDDTLRLDEIWSGEIQKPVLDVGEEIWISDLEMLVRISRKYRTTNGEIIYETTHIIRNADTERTEESRLEAIEKWFKVSHPELETFEQLYREAVLGEGVEDIDDVSELTDNISNKPEPIPTWEVVEKPRKNTWFGDLFSKK